MRRVPAIRQHDVSDCGVACLASIAEFHHRGMPIARLRQLAHTDRDGTSLLGLTRAAERLGYAARGVRSSPTALSGAPVPAIAHLRLSDGLQHYVVLERATSTRVWLMDPALGSRHVQERASFDERWTGVLLLLVPRDMPPLDRLPSRRARVWNLVASHRGAMMQALAGAIVYTLLGLATSIYVQQVVDSVLAEGRGGPLAVLSVAMIAVVIAQSIIGCARGALMIHVGQHIDAALILGYYKHLVTLPHRFFDDMRVGELTSRVNDAVKIRAFVGEVAVEAMADLLVVAGAAGLMFVYDWRLALLTSATLPVYALLYGIGAHVNRRQQRLLMERAAALEAQLVESIGAIGTLKRFGLEQHAAHATESRFVRLFRVVGEAARTGIWLGGISQLIGRLTTIGLLWLGATRALSQQLSTGQLMSCYALLGFLIGPLQSLVGFSRVIQEARVAGERLFEIMELEPEPSASPVPLRREDVGDVRLDDVHFRYGGRAPALAGVSCTCAAGEVTALVGESGSGKSTIAALLQRLYPLERGTIHLGASDIAHVELASLRRLVGVVPQTVDLFAGTIIENVALGDPEPDVSRVVALCAEVGMREAIERMPQGWLTPVGERGAALSGGERQRLAIARALYRDPALLVLDEATSALDPVSERLVLGVVRRVAEAGTPVILIAHRLAAAQMADKVIVLKEGRVVESGDPESLRRGAGAYARLWAHQTPAAMSAGPVAAGRGAG